MVPGIGFLAYHPILTKLEEICQPKSTKKLWSPTNVFLLFTGSDRSQMPGSYFIQGLIPDHLDQPLYWSIIFSLFFFFCALRVFFCFLQPAFGHGSLDQPQSRSIEKLGPGTKSKVQVQRRSLGPKHFTKLGLHTTTHHHTNF